MNDLPKSDINVGALSANIAAADPAERSGLLSRLATDVRISILNTIDAAKMGHIGGDFSVADVLTTLFFGVLRLDPDNSSWPDRDRFILSKGHCSAALYSVLAMRGFFEVEALKTFMAPLSALNGHPNRRKVAGVEANTGPLGHGLPIGVGCAIAARLAGADWRTFVVLGDGELQEGSNWEAAMAACSKGRGRRTRTDWSLWGTNGAPSAGRFTRSTAMTMDCSTRRSLRPAVPNHAASSPERQRAAVSPSSKTGSSGITRCRRSTRSNSP